MPSKVWDEITYPFPKFNGCTAEVWEWISKFTSPLYNDCDYLSMLGLQLNHVSKGGPGPRFTKGFSISIQILYCFTLTSILIRSSLQNSVHGTTALLSWHVQQFVAIWWPAAELHQGEVSIEFELRAKNASETGSRTIYWIVIGRIWFI